MASDSAEFVRVRRALLSVSDTAGLVPFARRLVVLDIALIATDGTRRVLQESGVSASSIEELGGTSAEYGGRIKTLQPAILGPILAPRSPEGLSELSTRGAAPIDLVAVNFYPFARKVRESAPQAERVEAIDVGGVTLARAGAKNFAGVAVLTDPSQYSPVADELERAHGSLSRETRSHLARDAFVRCSAYDAEIAAGLGSDSSESSFPPEFSLLRSELALRYGENPHQRVAAYRVAAPSTSPLQPIPLNRLKGPPLSYTNLIDLDTALGIVAEFPAATASVVKHATPCGVASGASISEALRWALATDPVARYGCVIAVNQPVSRDAVQELHGVFVDVLAAPGFEPDAREALEKRPKIRLVQAAPPSIDLPRWEIRSMLGHVLIQDVDRRELTPEDFRLVTTRSGSPTERTSLDFAWRVARHARSNSVVLAQGSSTVGIGSGQPTRVKAVELAVEVAGERAKGSVLASDAFFPFADGIEVAGRAGVSAIIQPGGSLRDTEVIAAAEKWKMAMYLTGWRIFRH